MDYDWLMTPYFHNSQGHLARPSVSLSSVGGIYFSTVPTNGQASALYNTRVQVCDLRVASVLAQVDAAKQNQRLIVAAYQVC